MAWISVHEQVIGGKLRSLAKEIGCSQNEALGLLVRLWLWGINNADKEGRIVKADRDDIEEALTIGIDKNISPKKAVDAMIATNWIDIEAGIYIHDWDQWQEQWYKAMDRREKDAERQRKNRAKKRSELELSEQKEKQPEKKQAPKAESNAKATETYAKNFEEFWSSYPKKVGKGEAYKKYKARLNDGWKESDLLDAAKEYASECIRNRTESKYIKHPKTFLSDSTPFTDYIKHSQKVSVYCKQVDADNPYGDWS